MTQDDVIRLAKEAGLWFVTPREDLIQDFAKLVSEHEREACAKVCDALQKKEIAHWDAYGMDGSVYSVSDCANAIRARGQV
jgi:hypothetical protein